MGSFNSFILSAGYHSITKILKGPQQQHSELFLKYFGACSEHDFTLNYSYLLIFTL